MWDSDGDQCCYRGPHFLPHRDGPCPNSTGGCYYSHNAPVHSTRPANARMVIEDLFDSAASPRGPGQGESFCDFLSNDLPWQQCCEERTSPYSVNKEFESDQHFRSDADDLAISPSGGGHGAVRVQSSGFFFNAVVRSDGLTGTLYASIGDRIHGGCPNLPC